MEIIVLDSQDLALLVWNLVIGGNKTCYENNTKRKYKNQEG